MNLIIKLKYVVTMNTKLNDYDTQNKKKRCGECIKAGGCAIKVIEYTLPSKLNAQQKR